MRRWGLWSARPWEAPALSCSGPGYFPASSSGRGNNWEVVNDTENSPRKWLQTVVWAGKVPEQSSRRGAQPGSGIPCKCAASHIRWVPGVIIFMHRAPDTGVHTARRGALAITDHNCILTRVICLNSSLRRKSKILWRNSSNSRLFFTQTD